MEVIERVFRYSRPDVFKLYGLGDIHLGTTHCAEDEVRKTVNDIYKDPLAYWLGLGDYSECITPRDKRWDSSDNVIPDWLEQDNISYCQQKRVVELFKPIKDKCIGLLYGNHESSIRKYNHDNIHKNICDDLDVPNLGYSCFVHLVFRRKNSNDAHLIKLMATHGTGGARTEGGKINYLVRLMQDFEANIYLYAHTHGIQLYSPHALTTTDSLKIKSKGKIGVLTGCWFRTYTQGNVASYGEEKVYKPSRIGCPHFLISPDKGTIEGITPPIEV